MKTTIKIVFLLVACLLLMPMTVSAASTVDFNLTIPNDGISNLLQPYVHVNAALNDNGYMASLNITGLPVMDLSGTKLKNENGEYYNWVFSEVGFNFNTDLDNLKITSATPSTFELRDGKNLDGFGYFTDLISTKSSKEKDRTDNLSLTLQWDTGYLTNIKDLFIQNADGRLAAAHVYSDCNTGFASTPIPAAAWLLGSGLIGLLGIKRKSENN